MNNRLILLRIAYGWGIIVDTAAAVLMLFPNLFVRVMNIRLVSDTNLGFGLLYGAPLMIGWTILLLWASQKPVERKAILLLTLPVVAGYILVEIYAIWMGWATTLQMLPMFISQTGMSTLFIISSSITQRLPNEEFKKPEH
jgi:hypothetical protein